MASLGADGMLAALREDDATASLRDWEARRDADDDSAPDQVAAHVSKGGSSGNRGDGLRCCSLGVANA